MSCLKEKRKPMVPLKTLDIIYRRRYVKNTQYYFANRSHARSVVSMKKKLKPYCVPKSEKLLSYIKYSDRKEKHIYANRLTLPVYLKDNLNIAATRDISERLFVEEPLDDVRAVVEIHPEFYNVIEGRPLRCFDDIKVYVNNIRNYAMSRQQIGYREDLIMKIEQDSIEESKVYEKIQANLKLHVKNFQRFLREDYNRACAKVTRAEKIYNELLLKNSEFLGYVTKLTILNNVIFKLDAIRNILKMYRRFLIYVAPLPWRQKYDESIVNSSLSKQFENGVFITDNDLIDTMDIDKIVEVARKELLDPRPAYIYFENPHQIIFLFRSMEIQSREYLTEHSKADIPFHRLQQRIKHLKSITKKELDYFEYYIGTIKNEIAREVYNEHHLQEKFFRLLHTTFYETIASPDSLKLKICIEYVYEQIFGKCEEGHQSLQDPMKILEVMYEDFNLKLDSLDFKIVNQARSDFFAQDLKTMRNAYKAERELKAFNEMTNALNKAFLPPAKYKKSVFPGKEGKGGKQINLQRSLLKVDSKIKPKKYKLSEEEKDGLLLFTEWCEGMNIDSYLDEYNRFVKSSVE